MVRHQVGALCLVTACVGGSPPATPSFGSAAPDVAADAAVGQDGAAEKDALDAGTLADARGGDGLVDIGGDGAGDATATADGGGDARGGDAPALGCKVDADCDDANSCTADTCKPDGGCAYAQIGGCTPALAPCNGENPCKVGVCDPAVNACVGCLQQADCKAGEVCQGKQCKPAQPCKSDVECKALAQVCGKSAGLCVDCNSGADCAATEQCIDTACVGSKPCKSSKDCPAVCNQQKGVCAECVTTDDCQAGEFCAADGRCAAAVCVGNGCGSGSWLFACKPDGSGYLAGQSCADNNICTDTACSGAKGCIQLPNQVACNDGSACSEGDGCANGKCTGKPVDCADGNPCSDDVCDAVAGCKHLANTAKCDDGNSCTHTDQCSGGACKGQGVDCDDSNPCTTDDCDSKQACLHIANTAACSDGNACTDGDACALGKCGAGKVKACDDANLCTTDACDPKVGCKFSAGKGGGPCDDGNKCTFNDLCTAGGQCLGGPGKCDDANPCTDDGCDPKVGCLFPANTLPCDDKNPCTGGDLCGNGVCKPGVGAPCDDGNPCTDQGCDLAKGGCFFTANSAPCEDGSKCTAGEKCLNGKCGGATLVGCDDNNACTADVCDPLKGCLYAATGACDDGDPCTFDTCAPATAACGHAAIAGCCQAGATLFSEDFDSGAPASLSVTNSSGLAKKGWQVCAPASSTFNGSGALYYGDPATKSFDFGASSGTATLALGNLPPGGKLRAQLQMRIDAEKYTGYDKIDLSVTAAGKASAPLWSKASLGTYACDSGTTKYTCASVPSGWFAVQVDLPAGYTSNVKLQFVFDTVDGEKNGGLGVLIDAVRVTQVTCP